MQIEYIAPRLIEEDVISLEQIIKRRTQRRRRVAMRMYKRFPLFATEFMQDEFPGYDYDTYVEDVTRKRRPGKKIRGRSQMKRQGRYPAYSKALAQYQITKDQKYLEEAQRIRNRLFKPFLIEYALGKERKVWRFASTTSMGIIQKLVSLKYSSWEELEEKAGEILKYAHIS